MPTDDSSSPKDQDSAKQARSRGAGELADLILRFAVRVIELVDLIGSSGDVM